MFNNTFLIIIYFIQLKLNYQLLKIKNLLLVKYFIVKL